MRHPDIGDLFLRMRRHYPIDTTWAIGRLLLSCVANEMDRQEDDGNGIPIETSGFFEPRCRSHEGCLGLR